MDAKTRHKYTHWKLNIRQHLFKVIAIILASFIAYDIYGGVIVWWMALIATAAGLGIGFVLGRLSSVRWDSEGEEVVTRMDVMGVIVILLYIAVALLRNAFLSQWFTGASLTAASLALAAGAIYGRYLGSRRSIKKIIIQNTEETV